ncbi:amidohydrolase [Mycolicibacterium frederiksbergense]|uniref:amidohydrolase n=1 Tax=Mycolicibacterium frederiksbergense TaxID=117567 RepID=UPI00265BFCC2|nr:amidohydrolase family protein [Mycolicibacterium frederiksbergense]MDO0972543.1 amidohydrolase family protein [Mycolicibacterium frederiksbergense]
MVLTNAKVHTGDRDRPVAGTVVIEDGVITHVGDPNTWHNEKYLPTYDLAGRTVLPGFIDSHAHPTMVSKSFWHVRLPWTTDVEEILTFIREYAGAHPVEEAPFLYFEYYPSATFRDLPPTKELLDTAVSDRPCLCQDFSEHEHWVNSKMLELMEITKDTPDPVPGLEMFVRDEFGEPTGLLRELVHMHFIEKMYEKIGWTPPQELTPERVGRFFRFLTEHGVTAVFEALVEDDEILQAITELDRRDELNVYYEGALRFRGMSDLPGVIEQLKGYHAKYAGKHIRMNTLKLFLDGTNESGNSAVIAPLCGHSGSGHGDLGLEVDELTRCFLLCNAEDVDVHIHLVGDRAFRVACDAVEAAQGELATNGGDWQIQVTLAHCELVDPDDMRRPRDLGIIINWTPHWSGAYFGEEAKEHLGEERWNRMYRFNEIAESGAVVTFCSDVVTGYELHRGNPLFGMQVAATRIDPEYPLDPAVYPDSVRPKPDARLSRELLVDGYTINGAKQLRRADKIGSLEAGKVANVIVLSADVFDVDAGAIGDIKVDAVLFEGRLVSGAL